MIKYAFIFLAICASYSCKTTKEQLVVTAQEEEAIVDIVEGEEEVSGVLDLVNADFAPIGDCHEDWQKRERLILYRDEDRIGRLKAGGSGQIFIITQINKNGLVIDTQIDEKRTTVENKLSIGMAIEIVQGYEFEPDPNAAKIECGTVKFFLTTK